ncbi:N-acetyl-beta-D-galactosaminidase [Aureococcus anophagefferens]|nr:N-acetyl-beta-D-galactosaminidase [Aureococcus anophagefferens]
MPAKFANGSSVATVDPAKMQLFADGNDTAMVKAELAVAFERFQRNAFPHAGAKSSAGAVGAVRPAASSAGRTGTTYRRSKSRSKTAPRICSWA